VGLSSPSEYVAARHPPEAPQKTGAPAGTSSRISFPFATSPAESTTGAPSTARLTVRPQRFSRSRRFAPPPAVRACFIPQPRPGLHFRGCCPPSSRHASSTCRALVSFEACPLPAAEAPGATDRPRGLQGVDPNGDPLLTDRWFRPARSSIPSCVFSPRRFVSEHLGPTIAAPPLLASTAGTHCPPNG
jgi:hypothetical protein